MKVFLIFGQIYAWVFHMFDAIVNGNVYKFYFWLFIASIQKHSWFLYVDLISNYLAKLTYYSSSFFVIDFIEHFMWMIILSANNSFTSSFLICMPFISFSCLSTGQNIQCFIEIVRADSLTLFLILGGKHSVFHH